MSARTRILGSVREALAGREPTPHPGAFGGWREQTPLPPVEAFIQTFTAAGGEVVRAEDDGAAAAWLADFSGAFSSAAVGRRVPPALRPALDERSPEVAELGVSMATCAIGETGSLVLDAGDGRRTQLLPPTHVVFVRATETHATLREALASSKAGLPSALGLHSGPSKSADIGQILVKGVHGPGRVVAVLMGVSP
jgi:L-lactate dehydrogenase complex protein LldG